MSDHIVSSYDAELQDLRRHISEMGGIAEKMLVDSITALVRRDTTLAQAVIASDTRLDVLQREVEEQAILMIARRQPLAVDLRETISAIRVSGDVERIGDLAKNIAKRVLAIASQFQPQKIVLGVQHMSDLGAGQLKDVLDAYTQGSRRDGARRVAPRRRHRRALHLALPRAPHLLMEDPAQHLVLHHLLFCAKNIERIGDHDHNIGETIHYLVMASPSRRAAEEATSRASHARVGATRATGGDGSVPMARLPARNRDRCMGTRVLIVEDEEPLTLLLRYNLEAEGYDVDSVGRGDEADIRLREQIPDLVVLDWMLPGLSGIELCRRIRARRETERLPVIMLTARGEEGDRVRGLATGADDYIVKPFSVPELLARVRALLRRAKPAHIANLLIAGDIELDRETHRVRRGGRELHLGPTEFKLLEFLMQSPGRVFSREQLLDGVWGHDVYIDERTVDVHVGRLRKAINRPRKPDPIRTVRGSGYSFDETFATAE
jgi:two-component system phosphate regulon response regulator PhoB